MKNFIIWLFKFHGENLALIAVALIMLILLFFGCADTPATAPTPAREGSIFENTPDSRADIKIINLTKTWYTVEVYVSESWIVIRVVQPNNYSIIDLEKRTYKVCITKEFETEEKCFTKVVTEDAEWVIKKR